MPRDGSSCPRPTRRSRTDLALWGRGREIPGNGFSKDERVRKRAEIERVFRKGVRYSCKGMRIHVIENALSKNRVVFVPVRSYPNSVARNRARRVARECWRLGKGEFVPGHDLAIVLFPGSDVFVERRAQLRRLLNQAGLKGR